MDFWNAMSFGAAVGDAIGFNASQKAALQLMAMQPDKPPQKNDSVRVDIEHQLSNPAAYSHLRFEEQFALRVDAEWNRSYHG